MSSRVCRSAVAVSAMRGTPGKRSAEFGELQIFRAEIMPPLADAMRLVDGEQRDLHAVQHLQKVRHHQPFGRDVEQVQPPGAQIRADGGALRRR